MLARIKDELKKAGANVFKFVLYHDGSWSEETLIPTCPCLNCYSLSKNFTATAIGIAQDMGLLTVEDPIIDFFPDELPSNMDEKLPRVKVRHLLTQTMGIEEGFLFEDDRYTHGTDDWVRLVLSRQLKFEPGERFAYSNSTYYLLSCIIRRVSGLTTELFLKKNLFPQLGIMDMAWETCPRGDTMGATGLYMSTADIAKLGVLYLNGGMWQGKQLLSEHWVREAIAAHPAGYDGPQYGYGFWVNDIGFRGGGAHSQIILVVPNKGLVFAAHSYEDSINFTGIVKKCLC